MASYSHVGSKAVYWWMMCDVEVQIMSTCLWIFSWIVLLLLLHQLIHLGFRKESLKNDLHCNKKNSFICLVKEISILSCNGRSDWVKSRSKLMARGRVGLSHLRKWQEAGLGPVIFEVAEDRIGPSHNWALDAVSSELDAYF